MTDDQARRNIIGRCGVSGRDYDDECWIWPGASYPSGYGTITVRGEQYAVHKWMYEQRFGKLSPGLILMHECNEKRCCNPWHLMPGTQSENVAHWHQSNGRHGPKDRRAYHREYYRTHRGANR